MIEETLTFDIELKKRFLVNAFKIYAITIISSSSNANPLTKNDCINASIKDQLFSFYSLSLQSIDVEYTVVYLLKPNSRPLSFSQRIYK